MKRFFLLHHRRSILRSVSSKNVDSRSHGRQVANWGFFNPKPYTYHSVVTGKADSSRSHPTLKEQVFKLQACKAIVHKKTFEKDNRPPIHSKTHTLDNRSALHIASHKTNKKAHKVAHMTTTTTRKTARRLLLKALNRLFETIPQIQNK